MMRCVVQKVTSSEVVVDEKVVGKIGKGLNVLVGFTDNDDLNDILYCVKKIVNLRVFEDDKKVMNLSLLQVGGEILSISQFTLYGDVTKGNRPSYIKALSSDKAKLLYDRFNEELGKYAKVETGIFGADMKVKINNDGPTTILITTD